MASLKQSSLKLTERSLLCPLCSREVRPASAGCAPCHLPLRDVLRNQPSPRRSGAWRTRVTGLVMYAGVVAWCLYQLPDTLPFVIPGVVLGGGYFHVLRGRPWWGFFVFATIVILVPLLVWPSMLTGAYSDLRNG